MIAWYISPYKIKKEPLGATHHNRRYCAMNDYTSVIFGEGGNWTEVEVLGNRAIVKVRASAGTLTILNGAFKRIPKDILNDSLSDLPSGAKQALKNEAIDMGYSIAELQARFPNDLGTYILKDVLKFYAKRRRKPRYDAIDDTIYMDGNERSCGRTVESVDEGVQ